MSNLAYTFPHDDVLTLKGAELNEAVAQQLGYRLGRELSMAGREAEWFAPDEHDGNYRPVRPEAMDYAANSALALALPLPDPSDCCEDWIHIEMGPQGRWIVRLVRFYRANASQPWKSREAYVADRDDEAIPMATAYARAWLLSHSTWPRTKIASSTKTKMTLAG